MFLDAGGTASVAEDWKKPIFSSGLHVAGTVMMTLYFIN